MSVCSLPPLQFLPRQSGNVGSNALLTEPLLPGIYSGIYELQSQKQNIAAVGMVCDGAHRECLLGIILTCFQNSAKIMRKVAEKRRDESRFQNTPIDVIFAWYGSSTFWHGIQMKPLVQQQRLWEESTTQQRQKIRATQEGETKYHTQHRLGLKGQGDLQNLIIIPESALGVCLHHRNVHQEPLQLLGLTGIFFVSWFLVGFFSPFQAVVQITHAALYRNPRLLENHSPTGWFRQILSHLHVLGRLDKNTTYAAVISCCVWLPGSTMSSPSLNIHQEKAGKKQAVCKTKKACKHQTGDHLPKQPLPAFIAKPNIGT